MKTTMILAALMCCLMSATAQQTQYEPVAQKQLEAKIKHVERLNRHENNFTMKLDSVTGEAIRFLYEYDDHLNCTKEMRYYEGRLENAFENTYDEQNRLTSVTHYDGLQTNKTEYAYNNQSLIVETTDTYLQGNTWKPNTKRIYEYDEIGNLTLFIGYNYFDGWIESVKRAYEYENGLLQNEVYYDFVEGDWQPEYKTEYSYNPQGLCTQVVSNIWQGEWFLIYKTEYAYNEQDLCTEMTYYNRTSNGEWSGDGRYVFEYDTAGHLLSMISFKQFIGSQVWNQDFKTEFTYDGNYNCKVYNEYYFSGSGDWNFENGYEMAYDTTVSIDQIAGFNRFWDALEIGGPILGRVDVVIPVYNKLLQMKVLEGETEFNLIDFHYSDYNNLTETTENQLVVWPNPASETVHIEGVEAAEVQVYNSLGQLVKIIQGNNEISVRDLAEGVYVLRVASEDGTRYMERVAVRR